MLIPVTQASAQCVLAGYPFSGNALDTTGNGYDGTVLGATLAPDCLGRTDSAYRFDGMAGYILLNNNSPVITTNTFTVQVRARVSGPGGGSDGTLPLFSQRDDDAQNGSSIINLFARNSTGDIQFNVRGSGNSVGVKLYYPAPMDSAWHCYAGSLGADDTLRLYLDGVEVATAACGQSGNYATSIDHVEIGRHSYNGVGGRGRFNGVIDEVILFDCAVIPDTVCCEGGMATSAHGAGEALLAGFSLLPDRLHGTIAVIATAIKAGRVEVLDMAGRAVGDYRLRSGRLVLDVTAWPRGIYVVRVQGERGVHAERFVW